MNRVTLLIGRVVLNPRTAEPYSRLSGMLRTATDPKPEEIAKKPYLNSLEMIMLYVFALIPFWIGAALAGFPLEQIAGVSALLLALGLIFGSVHLTLGLLAILVLGALNIFNVSFPATSTWEWTGLWWMLPLLLYMPVSLALQNAANSGRAIHHWWRLLWIIALGSVFAFFAYNNSDLPFLLSIWIAVLLGGLTLLTLTRSDAGKNVAGRPFYIGVVIVAFAAIVTGWLLFSTLFAPDFAAWLVTILHISFTLLFGFGVLCAALAIFMIDEVTQDKIIAPRRWFLYGSFLVLTLQYGLFNAILIASLAVLFYSLSFPALNRLQDNLPAALMISPATLTAVTMTFFVGFVLGVWAWWTSIFDILAPKIFPAVLNQPMWIFIAASLIFTVSGGHWTTIAAAILAILSLTLGNGLFATDSPYNAVFIWGALGAGAVLGFMRILAWPFLSLAMVRLSQTITGSKELSRGSTLAALDLVESYSRLEPRGRDSLLDALAEKEISPDLFDTDDGRTRYLEAQNRTASQYLLSASSFKEIVDADPQTLTPWLSTINQPFKDAQELPDVPKTRAYAAAIRASGGDTADPVLGDGTNVVVLSAVTNEPQVGTAGSNQNVTVSKWEIKARRHMIQLAYENIRPAVEIYWSLYDSFPAITEESGKQLPIETFADENRQRQEYTERFRYHVHEIAGLVDLYSQLGHNLDRLPEDEQVIIPTVSELSQRLNKLVYKLDYQERSTELAQYSRQVDQLRRGLTEIWLTIDRHTDQLSDQPNPWHPWLNAVYHQLLALVNLNKDFQLWIQSLVAGVLETINTIADLPQLTTRLEALVDYGERYGPMIDFSLQPLTQIGREAEAALAFPSGSYSRILGLQETRSKAVGIRSDLISRFVEDARVLTDPLARINQMLKDELSTKEAIQDGGFLNPYIAGNPIRAKRHGLFKGRRELAESIANTLRSGGNPTLILYGPRRTGKTSFLLQLPRLLPGQFIPVFMTMQGGASQSDTSFTYELARAIYGQMRLKGDLSRPDIDAFERHPFSQLNSWLDDVNPLLEDRMLFVTLDEFEAIGTGIQEQRLTEQVLGQLRTLMQHNEDMILMFAGVHTIEALGPNADSYFISAHLIEINYLTEPEAVELIRDPDPEFGRMPDYEDAVVAEIIRRTRCQPYLIQAICFQIIGIANSNNLSLIQMDTLDEATNDVLEEKNILYFRNIWNDAGIEGQALLSALADGPQNLDTEHISKQVLSDLLHRHVIRKVQDNTYEIEIPMVQAWVKREVG